ncbi:hypothetical protein GCM10022243_32290 [Saccharothrix violaceirubra]|uniref:Uncharacterized protein n=1 Tax=Saccharothrix violaceirubra TaxID=413306 RepID=A0A7W7T6E0_9PSEU|nr:hypothetical protein [Saccharothrix violaceirubra]
MTVGPGVSGPERGRLSSGHGSRVSGCEPRHGDRGIVPAAQAIPTLAHPDTTTATPVRRTHSLMPHLDERHLRIALRQCGRRLSAPGADGMTLGQLRECATRLLPRLAGQLAEGTWRPGPLCHIRFPTAVVPTHRSRLYARTTFLNAAPVELASPGIGMRVVRTS